MKSRRLTTWSVLSVSFALLAPLCSGGELIFDNGVTPQVVIANGFGSASFTNPIEGHQYQVADDFILPGDQAWSLDGARWTGVLGSRSGLVRTVGETLDFDILILADDNERPTGTPQDEIPGTALAVWQVAATGMHNGVFRFGAEFQVSFDPIVLQGDTRYWIVIAARGDFPYRESNLDGLAWGWYGEQETGNAWQGGADYQDDWLQQGRQQDFELFGEAITKTLPGDYNRDGSLDVLDIDLQSAEMIKLQADQDLQAFDHNGDAVVDFADRSYWIENLRQTWLGDANLDGEFSSLDFVAVFTAGKYEQNMVASWSEGDWNGDLRFNTSDLVAAFEGGGYSQGPRAATMAAVPEPASEWMVILSIVTLLPVSRRTHALKK